MPSIFDWSATPSANTVIDGINVAENCPAAGINNAIRSLAAITRQTFSSGLQNFLAGTSPLAVASGGTGLSSALTTNALVKQGATNFAQSIISDDGTTVTVAGAFSGQGMTLSGNLGIGVSATSPLDVGSANSRVRVDLSSSSPTWLYTNPTVTGYAQASHDALSHRWGTSGTFNLAYTGTGLGVGTLAPLNRLDVVGPALTLATQTTYAAAFGNTGGASGDVTIGSNSTAGYIQSWAGKPLYLNGQGNNIVTGPGSVGLNTATPTALLDVNGTARVRGSLTLDTALALLQGGTGATTASGARSNLGA